jgi:mitochondrial fission protein ELM1
VAPTSPLKSIQVFSKGEDNKNVLFSQINKGLSAQFQNFFISLKRKRPYWVMNSEIFSDWVESSQLVIPEADSEKNPLVKIETLASLDSL